MFNILNHQVNAYKNHSKISLYIYWNTWNLKKKKTAGKHAEQLKLTHCWWEGKERIWKSLAMSYEVKYTFTIIQPGNKLLDIH